MGRKTFKGGTQSSFVMLENWVFEHRSYRALSCGARSLHWELIRRYSGSNNGKIYLSAREAKDRLGISKNTVGRYFDELERNGFIVKTCGAFLGPAGKGRAAEWRLTHLTADGNKATMEFKKLKACTKNRDCLVPKIGTTEMPNGKILSRNPHNWDKQKGPVGHHNWDNIIYNHKVVNFRERLNSGRGLCGNAQRAAA